MQKTSVSRKRGQEEIEEEEPISKKGKMSDVETNRVMKGLRSEGIKSKKKT